MWRFFILLCLNCSLVLANTISVSLKNAPTSAILSYLSEESGKNIVLDGNIETLSTLRLENKSIDEIFKTISKMNKLLLTQEGDIVYIHKKKGR